MSVKAYVITKDPSQAEKIQVEDYVMQDVLGDKEEAVALQINELFNAITESVAQSLTSEGELQIEVARRGLKRVHRDRKSKPENKDWSQMMAESIHPAQLVV
jgi:hypothetical protein